MDEREEIAFGYTEDEAKKALEGYRLFIEDVTYSLANNAREHCETIMHMTPELTVLAAARFLKGLLTNITGREEHDAETKEWAKKLRKNIDKFENDTQANEFFARTGLLYDTHVKKLSPHSKGPE